ncbi:MAG: OmpA family protein [Saprospiraceae bacterium]|nr:OmpA family protein [Saprospiraceae bacterium]
MSYFTNIILFSFVIGVFRNIHRMNFVRSYKLILCVGILLGGISFNACKKKSAESTAKLPIDPVTGVDDASLYTHKLSDETQKAILQLEADSMIVGNLGEQLKNFIKDGVYDYGQIFKFVEVRWKDNSAELLPNSRKEIDELAKVMILFPAMRIKMESYTDNQGNLAQLEKISQKRVDLIKKEIVSAGVEEERISVKGFGSKYPVGDNKIMEGRLINNRIEITILKLFK